MAEAGRSQQKDERQVRSRIHKDGLKNDSSCLITGRQLDSNCIPTGKCYLTIHRTILYRKVI